MNGLICNISKEYSVCLTKFKRLIDLFDFLANRLKICTFYDYHNKGNTLAK